MIFTRTIQGAIESKLFRGKVIVLYGARQVGKTTLVKTILANRNEKSIFLNCDEPDIRRALSDRTSTELQSFIGNHRLVVIDEAQRVKNIGLTLKLLVDAQPEIQIIATGSSSFELSNSVKEPLTGRKFEFHLHPLSIEELSQAYSITEIKRLSHTMLRFGMYPEVVSSSEIEMPQIINEIAQSYLYKDILEHQQLKKADLLEKLLQALALQVGNEVSYRELAGLLGVDKITIEKYIKLLEQAFIIFILPPFSRNLRKEIGKMRKIYFCDLGIRNSIIKNFNDLSIRSDVGGLWENFILTERMKLNDNHAKMTNYYFWRTYDKKEIDLLEESGGSIKGYEIKWALGKPRYHKEFLEAYDGSSIDLINQENYLDFLTH